MDSQSINRQVEGLSQQLLLTEGQSLRVLASHNIVKGGHGTQTIGDQSLIKNQSMADTVMQIYNHGCSVFPLAHLDQQSSVGQHTAYARIEGIGQDPHMQAVMHDLPQINQITHSSDEVEELGTVYQREQCVHSSLPIHEDKALDGRQMIDHKKLTYQPVMLMGELHVSHFLGESQDIGTTSKVSSVARQNQRYEVQDKHHDQLQEEDDDDYCYRVEVTSPVLSGAAAKKSAILSQKGVVAESSQQHLQTKTVRIKEDILRGTTDNSDQSRVGGDSGTTKFRYEAASPTANRVQTTVPQSHRRAHLISYTSQQHAPTSLARSVVQEDINYEGHGNGVGPGGGGGLAEVRSSQCSYDYQTVTTMQHVNISGNIHEQERKQRRMKDGNAHINNDEDDDDLTMQTEEPQFMSLIRQQQAKRRADTTKRVVLSEDNNLPNANMLSSGSLKNNREVVPLPQLSNPNQEFGHETGGVRGSQTVALSGQEHSAREDRQSQQNNAGKQNETNSIRTLAAIINVNSSSNHTIAEEESKDCFEGDTIAQLDLEEQRQSENKGLGMKKKKKITQSEMKLEVQKVLGKYNGQSRDQAVEGGLLDPRSDDIMIIQQIISNNNINCPRSDEECQSTSDLNSVNIRQQFDPQPHESKKKKDTMKIEDQGPHTKGGRKPKVVICNTPEILNKDQSFTAPITTGGGMTKQQDPISGKVNDSFDLKEFIRTKLYPGVVKPKPKPAGNDSALASYINDYSQLSNYLAGQYPERDARPSARDAKLNTGRRKDSIVAPPQASTSARGVKGQNSQRGSVIEKLKMHQKQILENAANDFKQSQREHFKEIYTRAKHKRIADYFSMESAESARSGEHNIWVQQFQYQTNRGADQDGGLQYLQDGQQRAQRNFDFYRHYHENNVISQQSSRSKYFNIKDQINEEISSQQEKDTRAIFSADHQKLNRPLSITSGGAALSSDENMAKLTNSTFFTPNYVSNNKPFQRHYKQFSGQQSRIKGPKGSLRQQSVDLTSDSYNLEQYQINPNVVHHQKQPQLAEIHGGSMGQQFNIVHAEQFNATDLLTRQPIPVPVAILPSGRAYNSNVTPQQQLINVNQTFQIVQQINNSFNNSQKQAQQMRQAYFSGDPSRRKRADTTVKGGSGLQQHNRGGESWNKVISFMKKNPRVLKQMLNMMDQGKTNQQATGDGTTVSGTDDGAGQDEGLATAQFFNLRQKTLTAMTKVKEVTPRASHRPQKVVQQQNLVSSRVNAKSSLNQSPRGIVEGLVKQTGTGRQTRLKQVKQRSGAQSQSPRAIIESKVKQHLPQTIKGWASNMSFNRKKTRSVVPSHPVPVPHRTAINSSSPRRDSNYQLKQAFDSDGIQSGQFTSIESRKRVKIGGGVIPKLDIKAGQQATLDFQNQSFNQDTPVFSQESHMYQSLQHHQDIFPLPPHMSINQQDQHPLRQSELITVRDFEKVEDDCQAELQTFIYEDLDEADSQQPINNQQEERDISGFGGAEEEKGVRDEQTTIKTITEDEVSGNRSASIPVTEDIKENVSKESSIIQDEVSIVEDPSKKIVENSELERVRLELQRKEEELQEARKLIEQIQKGQHQISLRKEDQESPDDPARQQSKRREERNTQNSSRKKRDIFDYSERPKGTQPLISGMETAGGKPGTFAEKSFDGRLREKEEEQLKSSAGGEILNKSKSMARVKGGVYYETPRTGASKQGHRNQNQASHMHSQTQANNDDGNETMKSSSRAVVKHNTDLMSHMPELNKVKQSSQDHEDHNRTLISNQLQNLADDRSSSAHNQTFNLPYSDKDDDLSLNQPSSYNNMHNSSYQRAFGQAATYDWHQSQIMKEVIKNNPLFNSQGDPKYFKETELEYILEMFDTNYKNFKKAKMVDPFHRKALDTLSAIMTDLNMSKQFSQLTQNVKDPSVSNTIYLLEKCRYFIDARKLIFQVLKDIMKQEEMITDIRHVVDLNLSESVDETVIAQIREVALKVPAIALGIKKNILKLRDDFKLFSRTTAVSVKTKNVISNVFIYKKKDALKYVLQEYEDVRNLVTILDIKDLPYIGVMDQLSTANILKTSNPNSMVSRSSPGKEPIRGSRQSQSRLKVPHNMQGSEFNEEASISRIQ